MHKVLALVVVAIMLAAGASFASQEKQSEPASTKLQITQCALKVSGMTCGGCAEIVMQRLVKLEGVKAATVDYKSGDVQVEYDAKKTTPEKIVNAFNDGSGGFKAQLAKAKAKRS
jgi:Cu+-exporting ATPase